MKKYILFSATTAVMLFFPRLSFGQTPDFGDASGFAAFTSSGAFSNAGPSNVTGDVGNNSGAFTAFPPGVLVGQIHTIDAVSQQAAISLTSANTTLVNMACGTTIGSAMGNGQVLTAGVYCQTGVTNLSGNLILDAQGDANAVFVIKIGGTFTTAASSTITLSNSASLCNVYWHVVGAIVLGPNSTFGGTILGNAAVTLNDGANLSGRVFTTAGALSLTNNIITIASTPVSSTISSNGPTTFCSGDSIVLSGNVNGVWSTGETTSEITVYSGGDYYVTNSNVSCSVESNHINVIVNPVPSAMVGDSATICNLSNVILGASPVAGNTYSWTPGIGLSSSTIANPVASPSQTTTYLLTETIVATGCFNTNSIVVTVDNVLSASVIAVSGPTTFCGNEFVVLSGSIGGTWSNTAAISTSSLTVNTSGDYYVTNTNACNTVVSNHIAITVNPSPAAETGNDLSICNGGLAALGTASTSGHTYSWTPQSGLNSATSAHPYASPSVSTIYTLTEINTITGCSKSNSVIVTVNSLPPAITITNTTICNGESIHIGGNSTTGNSYLWTPAIDLSSSIISNPAASPNDTITYTLTETVIATGCSQSNSLTLSVNNAPTIVTQPADQYVVFQSPAVFFVEATGTNLTYQWRKGLVNLVNSSNISGVTTDTLTINVVGIADTSDNYNVVISGVCLNNSTSQNASLSIDSTTNLAVSDIAGIAEIVSVFPNPFSSAINVVLNDPAQTGLEISIYTVLGTKVMSGSLNPGLNSIEASRYKEGVYIYYVKSNERIVQHGKLVSGH
ncbi:ice-binding family protein [Fluviicola sp.]|uniref:ice-binding family protein n=1 Tax=Fluviicola sp. TaxID=1917219 RepID=UPI003D266FE1